MEIWSEVFFSAVFFIVIIHLTYTYWVPSVCRALSYIMEIHQRTKSGNTPFSQIASTPVGSMISLLSQGAVSSLPGDFVVVPYSGDPEQSSPGPEGPSSGLLKNNLSKLLWQEPQRWDRTTQMSPVWWHFFRCYGNHLASLSTATSEFDRTVWVYLQAHVLL